MKNDRKITKSIFTHEYRLIVAYLCQTRKELKISQRELARRLGVHHSYIAKIELAERRVDIVEFLRLFAAMDHNPTEFLENIYKMVVQKNSDKY